MHPGALSGIGLLLLGLGVPRLVDAIEIAYRLDIPRDFGVLPWLVLDVLGLGLLVYFLTPRWRAQGGRKLSRQGRRAALIWAALVAVAILEIPPIIWADVTATLQSAPVHVFYKALIGQWLVAASFGALTFAGVWYQASKQDLET